MAASSAALQAQPCNDRLSRRNFERLSRFIYDYSGIKMPSTKHTMLEGRLRRRLRATRIASFDDYCDYLFDGGLDTETVHLIDAVTTNKTDFFREPKHFDYMRDTALPALAEKGVRGLRTWSAACSTGAEPYTMAMVLNEFVEARGDGSYYSVLATDLSTDVLARARLGIYPEELVEPVPAALRRKYVLQAADAARRDVRMTPWLRSMVGFARMNLMDASYPIGEPMHLIFCRNVLIYFDKKTQGEVLHRLCRCLVPGGYLFIGHSETIAGLDLPVRTVANTVFQRL